MVGLGDLPSGPFSSRAFDVSDDGLTIVGMGRTSEGSKAFIWDPQNGIRSLEVVLAAMGIDVDGWDLKRATGISADGRTIVGVAASDASVDFGFVVVIPEPSAALLVLFGLCGLASQRR
jgi:uncharacterized membrane protein